MRLGELVTKVRRAYDDFEFHAIFHAVNNFCSVDLSAVYLDILKDRLYTFRADSPLRRGSQTVLCDITVVLAKLMAPILSFTAEEIWRMLPKAARKEAMSVHLTPFPEDPAAWRDEKLAARWEQLLAYRSLVQGELEARRREKVIGSSLEAHVHIEAGPDAYQFLTSYADDLSALFIVSRVTVKKGDGKPDDLRIMVERSNAPKCERCWNYREAVGRDTTHPTLCDRCVEAVR